MAGTIRFAQTVAYGIDEQSQSGPNDEPEPVSLKGGGYSTYTTMNVAKQNKIATITAISRKLKAVFDDVDGFHRNLGVGLFIKRASNLFEQSNGESVHEEA